PEQTMECSASSLGKFAQTPGTRSTLSYGLGRVHARKSWTKDGRLRKRRTVVSANAAAGGVRICRLVRLSGGELRVGRTERMEAGTSGKSGSIIFDPTCPLRRDRGGFDES